MRARQDGVYMYSVAKLWSFIFPLDYMEAFDRVQELSSCLSIVDLNSILIQLLTGR